MYPKLNFAEGLLLTCSFDYITDDWINIGFTVFFFVGCYALPMCFIIFFYTQIVAAVVSHERALKAQAKKMNVESLRSNQVLPLIGKVIRTPSKFRFSVTGCKCREC